jgi:ribonuclease P protein component
MISFCMKTGTQSFQKSERLCSRKTISLLFDEGNIFYTHAFKIVWCADPSSTEFPARVAFSVLKKEFRKAVDRNLIKRRMREAYRRNKQLLYETLYSLNIQIAFIIIFRGSDIPMYSEIEKSMADMIGKLIIVINERQKNC